MGWDPGDVFWTEAVWSSCALEEAELEMLLSVRIKSLLIVFSKWLVQLMVLYTLDKRADLFRCDTTNRLVPPFKWGGLRGKGMVRHRNSLADSYLLLNSFMHQRRIQRICVQYGLNDEQYAGCKNVIYLTRHLNKRHVRWKLDSTFITQKPF